MSATLTNEWKQVDKRALTKRYVVSLVVPMEPPSHPLALSLEQILSKFVSASSLCICLPMRGYFPAQAELSGCPTRSPRVRARGEAASLFKPFAARWFSPERLMHRGARSRYASIVVGAQGCGERGARSAVLVHHHLYTGRRLCLPLAARRGRGSRADAAWAPAEPSSPPRSAHLYEVTFYRSRPARKPKRSSEY